MYVVKRSSQDYSMSYHTKKCPQCRPSDHKAGTFTDNEASRLIMVMLFDADTSLCTQSGSITLHKLQKYHAYQ